VTSVDLDLLAANLRVDSGDLGAFVESLAAKLEDMLPGRVKVVRWRGRLIGPKVVRRISLDAGDQRLELLRGAGDAVQTRCSRVSGGIVLKSEELEMDAWLAALGQALSAEAERSQQTRQALERLLLN
jgi:hypothetical protein